MHLGIGRATGSYQPTFVGQDDGLDPVAYVQLGKDAFHVALDRGLLDHQCRGDLGVGHAAHDEFKYVTLARGELA